VTHVQPVKDQKILITISKKEAEATPWEKGPYSMKNKTNSQILRLWSLTITDPATG